MVEMPSTTRLRFRRNRSAMLVKFMKIKKVSSKPAALATLIGEMLCLIALILVSGCASFRGSAPGQSWSQTAAREDQEQQLSTSPDGGLTFGP